MRVKSFLMLVLIISGFAYACTPVASPQLILPDAETQSAESPQTTVTAFATRPAYQPGEPVDYIAQTGDTLPALALRFNTTEAEIREANPNIPLDATTMPPGMPMKIPIYYRPLWGTAFQIIPDGAFVNGPAAVGFDLNTFVDQQPGWLKQIGMYHDGKNRDAAYLLNWVADNYSISPKVLMAILEYQIQALTLPEFQFDSGEYVLGIEDAMRPGVHLQLNAAANLLNEGYYRWRNAEMIEFELLDGSIIRPDPWQNAGTVALQFYFAQVLEPQAFHRAIGEDGFAKTYNTLFGDPWQVDQPHIPGSLQQPLLRLPFNAGKVWALTGGPHTGWGSLAPFSALDFAPPTEVSGCFDSGEWVTALADGVVARTAPGIVVLDLDGDFNEHTGWVIFYLHVATQNRVAQGAILKAGDPIGHPSCEGGRSSGTHIHVARKYNGEWMVADGVIPFVMDGWTPIRGAEAYQGILEKHGRIVIANSKPDNKSFISAGE